MSPLVSSNRTQSNRNAMLAVFVTILLFLVAVGRTLSWVEFSNSMENLNVATVLEMARGGPILVPTLEGRPRIEKPPLTAWLTSLGVRRSTLAQLDDPDRARRAQAYNDLAMQVRFTALLTAALTLLAVFDFGRTIGRSESDTRIGAVSVAVCASSFFFLRFERFATTDVQLTLWLTVANAFLARAILNGLTWKNALGAGAALGLAFMSKGPVSLVQSIVPALAFTAWRWKFASAETRQRHTRIAPIVVGTIAMLGMALWWFALAAHRDPSIIKRWLSETNPAGADRLSGGSVMLYFILIPFMLPWSAFLIEGLIRIPMQARRGFVERSSRAGAFRRPAGREGSRATDAPPPPEIVRLPQDDIASRGSRETYAVVLLFTSLIIMTCFADRKDRYILPMVGIASVIAARRMLATIDREKDALPMWAHWLVLLLMSGLPLLGITSRLVRTLDGKPWFDATFGITSSMTALVAVACGMILYYRGRVRYAPIAAAVVVMFILQAVMIRGYRASREGRSEMRELAERIRASYPDAAMFNYRRDGKVKRSPVDLSIYLNRETRWTADPSLLPRVDRPQIYVTLKDKTDPAAKPAAGGWTFFEEIARDKDVYQAFVRPPQ